MAKPDMSRDYYTDLELPPLSDISEVKKQFRKLALKYHPDRNPGKETEMIAKFQTIQAANEVLSIPESKATYDANYNQSRPRYRYPAASGVRGNPWQNVSEQFPAPPRRGAASARTNPSAGASRYTNFAAPPTSAARATSREDQESRYDGWSKMRSSSANRASSAAGTATGTAPTARTEARPSRPVPPRPRTEAQKQKAEASFGARKSGYPPRSPVVEEPATDSRSSSTRDSQSRLFGEVRSSERPKSSSFANLDPLGFMDGRQSTPYQTHGGEKTNPFDGIYASRAENPRPHERQRTRESSPNRADARSRQRSSSVPDDSANAKEAAKKKGTYGGTEKSSAFESASGRAEDPYQPKDTEHDGRRSTSFSYPAGSSSSMGNDDETSRTNGEAGFSKQRNRPPLYGPPPVPPKSHYSSHSARKPTVGLAQTSECARIGVSALPATLNLPPEVAEMLAEDSPSGELAQPKTRGLNALETKQFNMLCNLIGSGLKRKCGKREQAQQDDIVAPQSKYKAVNDTDRSGQYSFSYPSSDSNSGEGTADKHPLGRNSADDINTRFVSGERPPGWAFNAGGEDSSDYAASKLRSKSGSRLGRSSPTKHVRGSRKAPSRTSSQTAADGANDENGPGFDAGQWTEKIGSYDFEPQLGHHASVSPTRATRPVKKKPVRKTMGTAGMVEEETSGGDELPRWAPHPEDEADGPGVGSPNAMDIDTPTPPEPDPSRANGARNIPVEPTKPEWRPGNAKDVDHQSGPSGTEPTPFEIPTGGSEDGEDFLRANLGDLKNVEPFAPAGAGLGSFSDLKSSLPFESKASGKPPLPKPRVRQPRPLNLPSAPMAPHPPPVLAIPNLKPSQGVWDEYSRAFHKYMTDWAEYSGRFADHFVLRKRQVDQASKDGFPWLDARGDVGIDLYLGWLEQDREVRRQWTAACEEHGLRVREFMTFRDKMKG